MTYDKVISIRMSKEKVRVIDLGACVMVELDIDPKDLIRMLAHATVMPDTAVVDMGEGEE